MENISTLTVLAKFKVLSAGRVFLGAGGGGGAGGGVGVNSYI